MATALLAIATATFAACLVSETRWPWLAPVRACAEAALIGGVADWFAVTALFRRPFGLPIPHTAVIPRNHDRIAAAIGRFVADDLLASGPLEQRLAGLEIGGRMGEWLSRPEKRAMLAARVAGSLPPLIHTVGEERWQKAMSGGLRKAVDTAITAPRMAELLSYMVGRGYHHAILDYLVGEARAFVRQNRTFIRRKVAQECPEWLPLWVEGQIAQGVANGLDASLGELAAAEHPWRLKFETFVTDTIDGMSTLPAFAQRVEELKARIFDDPAVDTYLHQLGSGAYSHLVGRTETVEALVAGWLADLSQRLAEDEAMRHTLNRWVRDFILVMLMPRRAVIGELVTDLIRRWRTDHLVEKLEAHVGKDLQYIRINGTVVGALLGGAIWAVSTLSRG
ncbi:DUF445 domain-containing protein [Magnetospirillum sp. UT-4]|uniref:DUF445 domain-containing protein n=1 Tax=Magnetospirillum sp. UT-4 TaxID=2681467 RepID=UPI0020C2BE12|nr:DUF445 domain-containing protein [Magnetospirillum sp. UT-4]